MPELSADFIKAVQSFATDLFSELRNRTADGPGVSRESYGSGEQIALTLFRERACSLGLSSHIDAAGNLHMSLEGEDPSLPSWLTGSHIDSVPQGGNYDGAAGVVAGLTVLAAYRHANRTPKRTITVVGIRGEEASSWYRGNHRSHFGSRAALGLLAQEELVQAINNATDATLQECLLRSGIDASQLASGAVHLAATDYMGFVELHIEQGPVLEASRTPVGIVSGIRGSARARAVRCFGEYTHSGAAPHEHRRDAVLAAVELCHHLDLAWEKIRARGGDLVFTVGKFFTNPDVHSLSKVPGEVTFTIDFRSQDSAILHEMIATSKSLADEVASKRGVRFELGEFNISPPSVMDEHLLKKLTTGARAINVPALVIPSGAGHDAQEFARAGFPSAMIFIGNANGSHNPAEAIEIEDFEKGTRLLAWLLSE